MSEGRQHRRELVFCHACENEWHRDEHGLECPECHSDIVEIVDEASDPRHDGEEEEEEEEDQPHGMSELHHHPQHHHPLRNHNPWQNEAPDPDEPNIEHVTFSPAPGIHFESFRTTSPMNRRRPNGDDAFGALFQTFATMFNPSRPDTHENSREPPNYQSRQGLWGDDHRETHNRYTFTARGGTTLNGADGGPPFDNIYALMQAVAASMPEGPTTAHGGANGARRTVEGNPFEAIFNNLRHMHNPANAAHGDAVFTEEALDRIISQMMDQAQGSSAPGPASAAAIAALVKKPADKNILGSDGKAECSVCMDTVNLGDEVTVLPCKHWFHGDCVTAWLKEHDTCPHCRQGITPREGNDQQTRAPDQAPRHDQNSSQPNTGTSTRHFFSNTGGTLHPQTHGHPPQTGSPHPSSPHYPIMPPTFTPPPGAFTQPGLPRASNHPELIHYPYGPDQRDLPSPSQPGSMLAHAQSQWRHQSPLHQQQHQNQHQHQHQHQPAVPYHFPQSHPQQQQSAFIPPIPQQQQQSPQYYHHQQQQQQPQHQQQHQQRHRSSSTREREGSSHSAESGGSGNGGRSRLSTWFRNLAPGSSGGGGGNNGGGGGGGGNGY